MEFSTAWAVALPNLLITLREGVEAALVVGIVLAYLQKTARNYLRPWVWWGIALGLGASVTIGALVQGLLAWAEFTSPLFLEILKTSLGTVAIISLTGMVVWMAQQAKSLKPELERSMAQTTTGWGILGLVTVAIVREGFEIVLFMYGTANQGTISLVGALVGLLSAVAIGYGLFGLGVKLPIGKFLQSLGILLLFLAAGLIMSSLVHLDRFIGLWHPEWCVHLSTQFSTHLSTQSSCILGTQVWDTHTVLSDQQFPGVILKMLLGYRDHLYLVQLFSYVTFLVIALRLYLRSIVRA